MLSFILNDGIQIFLEKLYTIELYKKIKSKHINELKKFLDNL